jgi:hypothetical protein
VEVVACLGHESLLPETVEMSEESWQLCSTDSQVPNGYPPTIHDLLCNLGLQSHSMNDSNASVDT